MTVVQNYGRPVTGTSLTAFFWHIIQPTTSAKEPLWVDKHDAEIVSIGQEI